MTRGAARGANGEPALSLRDRAGCLWLFASLFIAGGGLAISLAFRESSGWAPIAAFLIGSAHIAAGVWLICRSPRISARFGIDGRLHIERRWPFVVRRRAIARDQIRKLVTRSGKDSDGDETWALELHLHDGETVQLVSVELRRHEPIEQAVRELKEWGRGAFNHRIDAGPSERPDG